MPVGEAYQAGLDITFEGLFAGEARRRISLPGYPFQRERYWYETSKQRRAISGHPLLGIRHESAHGEVTFETEVSPSDPRLDERPPRLRQVGSAWSALWRDGSRGIARGGQHYHRMEDIQLHNPLVFAEKDSGEDTAANAGLCRCCLKIPSKVRHAMCRSSAGELKKAGRCTWKVGWYRVLPCPRRVSVSIWKD